MEISTASTILPTLRKLRDFLNIKKFPDCVAFLAIDLATAINERVGALTGNSGLRICSMLDPRFSFEPSMFNEECWQIVENDFKEFVRQNPPEIDKEDEKESKDVEEIEEAVEAIPEENEVNNEARKSDESLPRCNNVFIF